MAVLINATAFAADKIQKVAVVGAGLAGLTAAYRLQNGGMDVNLYEARNRVGGRVFTVYVNGSAAELGGQNITDGGEAVNLRRLIEAFNLDVITGRVGLDHSYFNGRDLIPVRDLLKNKKLNPHLLRQQLDELAVNAHNMEDVLKQIFKESDPLYKVLAVRLAAYEGATIDKLSPIYVETLYHMLLGGICAVHQGNEEEESFIDLASIKGGNGLLPEKMAAALETRLHLNMPLTRVGKNDEGLFKLSFQDGQEAYADILVLAIPCSVYNKIAFEEGVIPLEKLEAIQDVQYGTNAKVLLPFAATPLKKTSAVNDQIVSYFDAAQNILIIYYTGNASKFSKETILNAYALARPMIEKGYGEAYPFFSSPVFAEDQSFRSYNASVGYSWPNDPYARGSYSYVAPGQEVLLTTLAEENSEQFKLLFTPVQNLYFAGEHASILLEVPGTMEAACESGERIARTILKAQKMVCTSN